MVFGRKNSHKDPVLKPYEAAHLVDKNSRTMLKITQLLDVSTPENKKMVARKIEKLRARLNRRLQKLAKWADTPIEERLPPQAFTQNVYSTRGASLATAPRYQYQNQLAIPQPYSNVQFTPHPPSMPQNRFVNFAPAQQQQVQQHLRPSPGQPYFPNRAPVPLPPIPRSTLPIMNFATGQLRPSIPSSPPVGFSHLHPQQQPPPYLSAPQPTNPLHPPTLPPNFVPSPGLVPRQSSGEALQSLRAGLLQK